MKKRKCLAALLSLAMLGGCAGVQPNPTAAPTETNAPAPAETMPETLSFAADRVYSSDKKLSNEEIAEQYADLSPKLRSWGVRNPEDQISAEGLAYINECRAEMDRYFAENGGEEARQYAMENGMYDFLLDDRRIFPAADGGLFAVYGYRMNGALDANYYDIYFISDSEEKLLYSERRRQGDTRFLGNGEKLMMILFDRQIQPYCVLDQDGNLSYYWDTAVVVPEEEATS